MDVEQLLRSNFADRADAVDAPRWDLHETVLAGSRELRRRRTRQVAGGLVGGALAVALLSGGLPLLRTQLEDPGQAAGPRESAERAVDLYDIPTRGSLAGDRELLDRIVQLSWDDGIPRDPGESVVPPVDTRRVLFAGEMTDGQVWALVEGVVGDRTLFAWFTGATADGMALTWGPDFAFPDTPMALHDATGDEGYLVVVTKPGDQVRYGALDADGEPVGGYQDVPAVDGVAISRAPSPTWPLYVELQVLRDGAVAYRMPPQQFDTERPGTAVVGSPTAYLSSMVQCLTGRGVEVTVHPDSFGYETDDPAEMETYAVVEQQCREDLGYG
ncbi:hypothetical protein DQ244_11100 [Blastococcus sp. TBT05-19]|uniref:hypothetical protein n=1 Tax=Blastococcus sp. TBT05-19 TaxID=2250581 RepID=UPI000DEAF9D0|nr:hypothetical protein [Blastococcus sp. TBT05-19]RBY91819.1 hypothetical protein DQ244_11100 [Blastococcus sp. TBT05-19]